MALQSTYIGFRRRPPSIIPIAQENSPLTEKKFLQCLGRSIRDARKQKGMTQDCLSETAGVSAKYLSQVEQGHGNVTVLFLLRLSRALGLDMGALFYGCDDTTEERRVRREIWEQLQKLNSEELKRAARILRAIENSEDQNGG